jgi:hypothetical protein
MAAPTPKWVGTSTLTESTQTRASPNTANASPLPRSYEGTYDDCRRRTSSPAAPPAHPPAPVGTWIVESSNHPTDQRPKRAQLTIRWQGAVVLPPQEASITPENLATPLARNPMFLSLNVNALNAVQRAFNAPNVTAENTALASLGKTDNPELARTLFEKMRRGQEVYYLPSLRYSWTSFYATGSQPAINLGGYIETPGGPFSALVGK